MQNVIAVMLFAAGVAMASVQTGYAAQQETRTEIVLEAQSQPMNFEAVMPVYDYAFVMDITTVEAVASMPAESVIIAAVTPVTVATVPSTAYMRQKSGDFNAVNYVTEGQPVTHRQTKFIAQRKPQKQSKIAVKHLLRC